MKKLVELKKYYLDETSADVHFLFDNNTKRLPAHKIILAAQNDVFHAMFFGGVNEKGDVNIAGTTYAGFREFLQFFYANESDIKLTMDNIDCVLGLGHQYLVKNCVAKCVEFLKQSLTVETVVFEMNLAILYNQQELLQLCDEIISLNTCDSKRLGSCNANDLV